MNDSEIIDVSEASIVSLTEEEMAEWRREQGATVIYRHGRYWERSHNGFCWSIHWLARMRADEAKRPISSCWGYCTSLCDADVDLANGSIPVHLLTNVKDYDMTTLSSNRRYKIRKSRRLARVVQLTGPGLLREQGYELLCSVGDRLGRYRPGSKEKYLAGLDRHVNSPATILAALVDGRLAACLEGYAVERTAYIHYVYIATEWFSTEVGTGLVFDFVQLCRRSSTIEEVVYGKHFREKKSLETYKESVGFPIVYVPSRVSINPVLGLYIRWRKPHVFYRLTGRK
jgi:hypothetical protein